VDAHFPDLRRMASGASDCFKASMKEETAGLLLCTARITPSDLALHAWRADGADFGDASRQRR
jgi:hypothetical protein